jgi:hypothetical protein
MKKIFMAVAILSASFIIKSCTNGPGGNPKATLVAFFEALGKKDIEGARKLATADSKSMIDMMEMGMKMSKDTKETDKFDKNKMEFGNATIDGDKATVPVKEKTSGEMTNFTLKKEGGAWKVAFDKASMMQMGMDKMKETNPGAMDSLSKQMDEIKNMNVDSMKDLMNNGMKSLDSLKNLMKEKGN